MKVTIHEVFSLTEPHDYEPERTPEVIVLRTCLLSNSPSDRGRALIGQF